MKKIIKKPFLTFILGAVIFGGINYVFATNIFSNDISIETNYKKNNGEKIENVKEALDELQNRANPQIIYGEDESNEYDTYRKITLGFKPRMVSIIVVAPSDNPSFLRSYTITKDNKTFYARGYYELFYENNEDQLQITDDGFKWHVKDSTWGNQHMYYYAVK